MNIWQIGLWILGKLYIVLINLFNILNTSPTFVIRKKFNEGAVHLSFEGLVIMVFLLATVLRFLTLYLQQKKAHYKMLILKHPTYVAFVILLTCHAYDYDLLFAEWLHSIFTTLRTFLFVFKLLFIFLLIIIYSFLIEL